MRPLKNEVGPSCLIMLEMIRKPLSGFSKFLHITPVRGERIIAEDCRKGAISNYLFWIRVLITSKGAETTSDEDAPAMDAMKFCPQVAAL